MSVSSEYSAALWTWRLFSLFQVTWLRYSRIHHQLLCFSTCMVTTAVVAFCICWAAAWNSFVYSLSPSFLLQAWSWLQIFAPVLVLIQLIYSWPTNLQSVQKNTLFQEHTCMYLNLLFLGWEILASGDVFLLTEDSIYTHLMLNAVSKYVMCDESDPNIFWWCVVY